MCPKITNNDEFVIGKSYSLVHFVFLDGPTPRHKAFEENRNRI